MADKTTTDPMAKPADGAATPPHGPPAGDAKPAEDAPKDAASKAKEMASAHAHAAKDAAKNAAKAGLAMFQKAGAGLGGKLKAALLVIARLPLLLFQGELSTRLLMLGFLVSIAVVGVTGTMLAKRYLPEVKTGEAQTKAGQGMNALFQRERELSIASASVVFLERFAAPLEAKTSHIHSMDLEIFIETDAPVTSSYVKAHFEEAREIVGAAVQHQSYEKLLTDEGKQELREKIAKALTAGLKKWHSKGKVKRVFFGKFVMG